MKVITFVFILMLMKANAGRILIVVPTPSVSHQVVFQPFIRALAQRGHDVVTITTDPMFNNDERPPNLIEIDVRDVSYETWRKSFMVNTAIGKKRYLQQSVELFVEQFRKALEAQLKTESVRKLVKGDMGTFDLLILEASVRPAFVFSHIFKAPVIQMCTFGAMTNSNYIIGAPPHPLLYPLSLHQRLYNLTIWEEIDELYKHISIDQMYTAYESVEEDMLRSVLGDGIPSLQELSQNVQMMFYNSDPIWADSQPVPPSVVYIGGINKKPHKELPEDLKSYLDSAKNGVIYISFGNNVKPSLLPTNKVQMLSKIFSQLPYNVLWRWDADVPDKPDNVKLTQWVPQTDLLSHPNVKLFITQGGLQSTEEAIDAGVPLIGIPMIADQWFNTEKYEHFSIGKRLDMETSTEDEFRTAITTVLTDKSYRENILKLRTLLNDKPWSPIDRAVLWTEYVLRHGGAKHLRSPAAFMSWSTYYEIELVIIILAVAFMCVALVVGCVVYFMRWIMKLLGSRKLKVY